MSAPMHVAAPSLSNVANQLQLQAGRSGRQAPVSAIAHRYAPREQVATRTADPEVTQKLSDLGKMHNALLSALKNNRQIDGMYLFDTVQ